MYYVNVFFTRGFEGMLIYIYDIDICGYIHSFPQVRTLHMDQSLQIQWSTRTKNDLAYLNSLKEKIHS